MFKLLTRSVRAAVEVCRKTFGGLDTLVNSAGVIHFAPLTKTMSIPGHISENSHASSLMQQGCLQLARSMIGKNCSSPGKQIDHPGQPSSSYSYTSSLRTGWFRQDFASFHRGCKAPWCIGFDISIDSRETSLFLLTCSFSFDFQLTAIIAARLTIFWVSMTL